MSGRILQFELITVTVSVSVQLRNQRFVVVKMAALLFGSINRHVLA